MRILLANHTSAWSGAEASLMRVAAGLRADHDLAIACPDSGKLAQQVDRAQIERLTLPQVDASLRLHPLGTPVGLSQLGAGGLALGRAARRFRADVIHANTPRAGIMAALGSARGPPFVVRAHEHVPPTPIGRAVRALLVARAGAIVAVSDFTAARFNDGLPRPVATRVYNSIDHSRFSPALVSPAPIREELGLAPKAHLIGQVAQITPWKRQDTSIRTLAELRGGGMNAHLLLVGQVAFGGKRVRLDNYGYLRSLERLLDELSVRHAVHFLGQRDDVPAIMRALDLSLLPSSEEPFGLVTVESLALGTPPLVSAIGSGPELVQDGVSGRVLTPGRPELWARAARELLSDPPGLALMGERGPHAAERFRDEVHAEEMLAIYERAGARSINGRAATRVAAADEERVRTPWPS
ncbi:MAG: glycosyltransferase [Actinomycetota bacterium]|nr:glycosyltransferase [Actinomycetota bacterium]